MPVYFMSVTLAQNMPGGSEENQKQKPVTTVSFLVKIQTRHLPKAKVATASLNLLNFLLWQLPLN
jgi:hypothetical protein